MLAYFVIADWACTH